jgi:small ligand-binding sensory domain FIST
VTYSAASPASSPQGELGPVGGKDFLHGFTASKALFVDD